MSYPALGRITRPPPVYKNTSLPSRVYPAPTGSSKINSRLTGGLFEWANEGPLCRGHSPHIADENIITKGSEDKTLETTLRLMGHQGPPQPLIHPFVSYFRDNRIIFWPPP